MGRLDGKVALITGAARGQGETEARLFAREGARVVVTDILADQGEAVARDIGDAALFQPLDVTSEGAWATAVANTVDHFGQLDILVNNAAVNITGTLEETRLEDYELMFRVNQLGGWLGMRSVIAPMRNAGGGSIVNIVSMGSMTGLAKKTAYLSTKWAMRGMTQCAAAELGEHGIRVNAVHPGGVATDMTAGQSLDTYVIQPIPRMGRPLEIAQAALFLASDDSSYCTGAEIVVDGGRLAGAVQVPEVKAEVGA